jgi:hypothetical protein
VLQGNLVADVDSGETLDMPPASLEPVAGGFFIADQQPQLVARLEQSQRGVSANETGRAGAEDLHSRRIRDWMVVASTVGRVWLTGETPIPRRGHHRFEPFRHQLRLVDPVEMPPAQRSWCHADGLDRLLGYSISLRPQKPRCAEVARTIGGSRVASWLHQ